MVRSSIIFIVLLAAALDHRVGVANNVRVQSAGDRSKVNPPDYVTTIPIIVRCGSAANGPYTIRRLMFRIDGNGKTCFDEDDSRYLDSIEYPVSIEWSRNDVYQAPCEVILMDGAADIRNWNGLFFVNMRTGKFLSATGTVVERFGGDSMRVIIRTNLVKGFDIGLALGDGLGNGLPPTPEPDPAAPNLSTTILATDRGTSINYYIPAAANVVVDIGDSRGTVVRTFKLEHSAAGNHTVAWDARDEHDDPVKPGIYTCRLIIGDLLLARNFVVAR